MKLDTLNVYKESQAIGEEVWAIVAGWDFFARDTVGKQIVKSVDSIAANIAEGYGRFYYKENKQFCYYSRGSLIETICWIDKSKARKLMTDGKADDLKKRLDHIHLLLNGYIKSIGCVPYKHTPVKLSPMTNA
jgi:four helix bundle protein